jgi:hypothetical protein
LLNQLHQKLQARKKAFSTQQEYASEPHQKYTQDQNPTEGNEMSNPLEIQLEKERRKVDFDVFDISTKELVSMVEQNIIDIAPDYQRQFRWPESNQSRLIESIFLGIPVPSLFMAANNDGSWELIDGVQRLTALIRFMGTAEQLAAASQRTNLTLQNLDILTNFNGSKFSDFPTSMQRKFSLRPLKITTLSDKSDLKVRFDLFERLNTGGVTLTHQEIRSCVYRGKFNDFLEELSSSDDFLKVVNFSTGNISDGTKEELVLKFFAYFYKRQEFDHSVKDFLNDYMQKSSLNFNFSSAHQLFNDTFFQLSKALPNGIRRGNRQITPINLFEAVAIGAADAITKNIDITKSNVRNWIDSEELKSLTSGATNSRKRLNDRIEWCLQRFSEDASNNKKKPR